MKKTSVKHKNCYAGSEQAAELLLSPLLTSRYNLVAFQGLDISVAMAVLARVITHSHLSFLASAPCSEKVCCDLDTIPRGSSQSQHLGIAPSLTGCNRVRVRPVYFI